MSKFENFLKARFAPVGAAHGRMPRLRGKRLAEVLDLVNAEMDRLSAENECVGELAHA